MCYIVCDNVSGTAECVSAQASGCHNHLRVPFEYSPPIPMPQNFTTALLFSNRGGFPDLSALSSSLMNIQESSNRGLVPTCAWFRSNLFGARPDNRVTLSPTSNLWTPAPPCILSFNSTPSTLQCIAVDIVWVEVGFAVRV